MKLTILGSGDFRPDAPLASAGYVVEAGDTTLKLDFGRGNLIRMAEAGIDWKKMSAILISHIHPDHIGDVMQYLQAFTLFRDQRKLDRDIPFYGPKGFPAYFDHFRRSVQTSWTHIPEVKEIIDERFTVGDFTISALTMKHSQVNNGYRIEHGGKVLCYTGDTEINDNLLELARNADVLLTECSSRNSDTLNGHMRPTDIARVAREANVRHIVLTHYPAEEHEREFRVQELRAEFAGPITAGKDLLTIDI